MDPYNLFRHALLDTLADRLGLTSRFEQFVTASLQSDGDPTIFVADSYGFAMAYAEANNG